MKQKFDLETIKDSKLLGFIGAAFAGIAAYTGYLANKEKEKQHRMMWEEYESKHSEEQENEEE